jgi:hypothetical protein
MYLFKKQIWLTAGLLLTLTACDGTSPTSVENSAPSGNGVTITGSAVVGATLSVDTSSLADADGLGALSLQWKANGVDIGGGTGTSYQLTANEIGSTVLVEVSYTDGGGTNEIAPSNLTVAVIALPSAPANLTAVGGDTKVTLTWDPVSQAAGYNVYYAEETTTSLGNIANYASLTGGALVQDASSGDEITALTAGISYYFVVTGTFSGVETSVSSEVSAIPNSRSAWLSNAGNSSSDTSANLNTINGAYSTSAFPFSPGGRLSESKYVVGGYNSTDDGPDSKLFIYNPLTKTSLVEVTTGNIERPHLLHDISTGRPVIYNGKAVIADGMPWSGGNSVGTLTVSDNTFSASIIPSINLSNSSSHMMGDYGFVEGDIAYMHMTYKNGAVAPGVWIVKWDIANNTFSHLDFTASVLSSVGAGTFDDRAHFVTRGKDSDHLLVGVYSASNFVVAEVQESTQSVTRSINITTATGNSGFYEAIVYRGNLYMVPRSETGDATGMDMLKIGINDFSSEVISIDQGATNNAKRQKNTIIYGFSQMAIGDTGLFIPRYVVIDGKAAADQFALALDLDTPRFYFISLDGSSFQSAALTTSDNLRFTGLSAQESGQVIGATYWNDISVGSHNNQWSRNGAAIFHAPGSEM